MTTMTTMVENAIKQNMHLAVLDYFLSSTIRVSEATMMEPTEQKKYPLFKDPNLIMIFDLGQDGCNILMKPQLVIKNTETGEVYIQDIPHYSNDKYISGAFAALHKCILDNRLELIGTFSSFQDNCVEVIADTIKDRLFQEFYIKNAEVNKNALVRRKFKILPYHQLNDIPFFNELYMGLTIS